MFNFHCHQTKSLSKVTNLLLLMMINLFVPSTIVSRISNIRSDTAYTNTIFLLVPTKKPELINIVKRIIHEKLTY